MAGQGRIQISFEPDKGSISAINADIAKAIADAAKTGIAEGLKGAFNGADFSAAANKFADSIQQAVDKLKFDEIKGFSEAFTGSTKATDQLISELNAVKQTLTDINTAMSNNKIEDMAVRSAAGIGMMTSKLESVLTLLDQINSKESIFSMSIGTGANTNDVFSMQRKHAQELIAVAEQLQIQYKNLDKYISVGTGAESRSKIADIMKQLYGEANFEYMEKLQSMVIPDIGKITEKNAEGYIASLEKIIQDYSRVIELSRQYNDSIGLPDMSRVEQSSKALDEYKAKVEQVNATAIEMAKNIAQPQQTTGVNQVGTEEAAQIEERLRTAQSLISEINGLFAGLRETMAETFKMDDAIAGFEKLRDTAKEVGESIKGLTKDIDKVQRTRSKMLTNEEKQAKAIAEANKKIVVAQEKAVSKDYMTASGKFGNTEQFSQIAEMYKEYEVAALSIKNGASSATNEETARVTALRDALMQQIAALHESASAHQENAQATSNDTRQTAGMEKRIANLSRNITQQLRNVPGLAGSAYGKELQSIQEELSGKNIDVGRLDEIAARVAQIRNEYTQAGFVGTGFFSSLMSGVKNIAGFTAMVVAMRRVIAVAKSMVNAVKEIDSAMIELRKVTDLTSSGYDKFYTQAVATSQKIGATVSDTINATAD